MSSTDLYDTMKEVAVQVGGFGGVFDGQQLLPLLYCHIFDYILVTNLMH